MGVRPGFWENRRVFITGHTGFKGTWLTLWLSRLGAILNGYSLRPSSRPNLFELADAAQDIDSTFADIRDIGT
jgi:CDP-glucose 4,6-dehydratase